jgi:HAMP domain-containing protein
MTHQMQAELQQLAQHSIAQRQQLEANTGMLASDFADKSML